MLRYLIQNRNLNDQAASVMVKFKEWKVSFGGYYIKAVGEIKPTPRSETYTVEVKFFTDEKKQPLIRVLSPKLVRNHKNEAIPHMYGQKYLCLFMPAFREFKSTDLITDTIIPWTSLWLYYYEIWHITDRWEGGGIHIENI
ncbi:hypothetical protein GCM10007424_00250 [Flavobacterium suaedae]|uniref:Type II CBASS E2 protein domain-containing protein n=1 Tax=Flavobacterium suaedae TaxID=1767027 RepID=A0ABQ1JB17_9FLAO|nr:hypothetical protein [Flavobacterium suaedae]GGB64329.1 hypothetical protein GCM10007424_00250 [Flavobacterium suaedae]